MMTDSFIQAFPLPLCYLCLALALPGGGSGLSLSLSLSCLPSFSLSLTVCHTSSIFTNVSFSHLSLTLSPHQSLFSAQADIWVGRESQANSVKNAQTKQLSQSLLARMTFICGARTTNHRRIITPLLDDVYWFNLVNIPLPTLSCAYSFMPYAGNYDRQQNGLHYHIRQAAWRTHGARMARARVFRVAHFCSARAAHARARLLLRARAKRRPLTARRA